MNFLETIFHRLQHAAHQPVLQEVHDQQIVGATGGELLSAIQTARAFLRQAGLHKRDRCALLAHNGIHWAAMDLAIMAEGGIAVPLYARQAPEELVAMMRDCSPILLCCGDQGLRDRIGQVWPDAPPAFLLEEIFGGDRARTAPFDAPCPLAETDAVTILYTSGTSGEPKGVMLSVGNLNHMLRCATERLDLLMGPQAEPDRVFHYLPFCFAGSWILLLSCLSRNSALTLSTDLSKLADEMRLAAPDYFLNVPVLLERMRARMEEQLQQRGGVALRVFRNAQRAWSRRNAGQSSAGDFLWFALARALLFPAIRKRLGRNLKALICGSAPLAKETQLFFLMLGLPVLQVYGLTETTAICTMDVPGRIEPGMVGLAIDGIEMKLGERDEILVQGPHLFPGYWNRPQATEEALRDGWFHTGDQGEVDRRGYWRITGRLKNLIVLGSGHNVAPEPMEEILLRAVPGAQHVVLIGSGRSYLTAIVAGEVTRGQVESALEALNAQLPHYKRVHAFHISQEPFTVDNGLLTVNGKLKRDAIAAHFGEQIEELYRNHTG